jgi:hypothetical protein
VGALGEARDKPYPFFQKIKGAKDVSLNGNAMFLFYNKLILMIKNS